MALPDRIAPLLNNTSLNSKPSCTSRSPLFSLRIFTYTQALTWFYSGDMRIPSAEERNAVVSQSLGLALGTEVAPPNPRSTVASSAASSAAVTTSGAPLSPLSPASATTTGSNRGIGGAGNAQNTGNVSNDVAKESSSLSDTGAASKLTSSAAVVLGSLVVALALL